MTKPPTLYVFTGANVQAHDAANDLTNAIKDLIYKHSDRMLVATAIGCLEIAKLEILREQEDM